MAVPSDVLKLIHKADDEIVSALCAVLALAREELNLHRIIAPVVSRNKASIRMLEKHGFIRYTTTDRTVTFDGNPDRVLLFSLPLEAE